MFKQFLKVVPTLGRLMQSALCSALHHAVYVSMSAALPSLAYADTSLPAGLLLACSGDEQIVLSGRYSTGANGDTPPADKLVSLGRQIFFDPGLSASGRQSCASCHSPAAAYGPPNRLSVQAGGPRMKHFGMRAAPSLRYVHAPQPFTEHYIDLMDNNGQDSGPAGGRTWDGRVNGAREQALMPLLDPLEMANANRSEIVARLRKAPYAAEFDRLLSAPGTHILDDEEGAISWLTTALEFFEQSPEDFHPFSSKYDAYMRGQARLTAAEQRGFKLFNDKAKGNCASCHPSVATSSTVVYPRFTDFEYAALGVPRNRHLAVNRDPQFYDLGLCGPQRHDLADQATYCGKFRAPTLRNAALRHSFFHNGVLHSLRDVVEFYVTRETKPARWFGRSAQGRVQPYDDLPPAYRGNVNTDAPFKPLPGNKPRLTAREINDLLAFLGTLSDGYAAPHAESGLAPYAERTMPASKPSHPPKAR
jgi:cytochrome c peroxidase